MELNNLEDIFNKIIEGMSGEDEKTSRSKERFDKNVKRLINALKKNKYDKAPDIIHSILRNINEIRRITRGKIGNSNICSIVEYPHRGDFGDNKFRGNTSGYLLMDLFENVIFKPTYVLDPAEGGETTRDVCRHLGIKYVGLDLIRGFNLLEDPFPDDGFDFIFFHPPYANIVEYWKEYYPESKQEEIRTKDLSGFKEYEGFLIALEKCINRLMGVLRKGGYLALLIGDVRKSGIYKCIYADLYEKCLKERMKYLVIKIQHNMTSLGYNYYGKPFIPIAHEFVPILLKK